MHKWTLHVIIDTVYSGMYCFLQGISWHVTYTQTKSTIRQVHSVKTIIWCDWCVTGVWLWSDFGEAVMWHWRLWCGCDMAAVWLWYDCGVAVMWHWWLWCHSDMTALWLWCGCDVTLVTVVWLWHDCSVTVVWLWCDTGDWCDCDMIAAWLWCDCSVTVVWLWCDTGDCGVTAAALSMVQWLSAKTCIIYRQL